MAEKNYLQLKTTPEIVANYACHCGENPLWNPFDRKLYWCDIPLGRVFRFDPARNTHEMCLETGVIGGFTIESDGALLLFMERGAVRRWANGAFTTVLEEIADERETRFNDVMADPEGRVFCGTMASKERAGRLYRLDPDGHLEIMAEGIQCSNGLALSRDQQRMYYADSYAHVIYVFDYARATGSLRNRQVFVRVAEEDGFPDGITLDADGQLWSAQWDGSCLIRYRPDGTEDFHIAFPVKKVSSLTFGGPDYSDIYVTSAGGENPSENGELAGALFRLNLGIRGVPEFFSKIFTGKISG
jgi:D-xylonolactonase